MTAQIIKRLTEIGFSSNAADVYACIFQHGEVKAGEISKVTSHHRQIVYNEIEKLLKRNLITEFKERGVSKYRLLNPERLLEEIENQKLKVESVVQSLSSLNPSINHKVLVYEGLNELRANHLKQYSNCPVGSTVRIIGSSELWADVVGKDLIERCMPIYDERNISFEIVTSKMGKTEKAFQESYGDRLTYKAIPDIISPTTEIAIFPEYIAIKLLIEPYSVIEIYNPKIVESYNRYFDTLWGRS